MEESAYLLIIFFICGLLVAFLIAYFLIIVYEELVFNKMMYINLIKKKYSKMVKMYNKIKEFNQIELKKIKAFREHKNASQEKAIAKEKQIQESLVIDFPQRKVV